MTPKGAMPAARARVLIALLRVYRRDGRATLRTVADEAGRHHTAVYTQILKLRHDGLVDWTEGETGSLRPLVTAG